MPYYHWVTPTTPGIPLPAAAFGESLCMDGVSQLYACESPTVTCITPEGWLPVFDIRGHSHKLCWRIRADYSQNSLSIEFSTPGTYWACAKSQFSPKVLTPEYLQLKFLQALYNQVRKKLSYHEQAQALVQMRNAKDATTPSDVHARP